MGPALAGRSDSQLGYDAIPRLHQVSLRLRRALNNAATAALIAAVSAGKALVDDARKAFGALIGK